MTWTHAQGAALRAFFAALNESRVDWMVLRNYEGLPDVNSAKDVDVLVANRDVPTAIRSLDLAMRAHGFTRVAHVQHPWVRSSTYWRCIAGAILPIKIDLLEGCALMWRGAPLVRADVLFSARVPHGDFYVPDPLHDGLLLWMKTLVAGGSLKERYRPVIVRSVADHPRAFQGVLNGLVGERLGAALWSCLSKGDFDETMEHRISLCRSAWLRAFRDHPLQTVNGTLRHFWREALRRARRPRGTIVAVVGPDGSGKSTFIERLREALSLALVKEREDVCVQHFRPNVFPNLRKLLGGSGYDEGAEEFTSPHRARPAGRVSSFLRHAYYWLDYVVGYWSSIRRKCIAGKVYVFDRYCYDFIADPRRSRVDLPDWVRRLFLELTPEPDVVFFLDCDAETIYARKQELALPEIDRQLRAYRSLAGTSDRFVMLDARRDPEELARAAVRHVVASFEALP
jgi:thymidylate kinase